MFYYGFEGDYVVMVLDYLGPSLEEMFTSCGRRFSLKTTVMLIDQMLQRIEFVHMRSIIHRDIKPHNFLLGRNRTDRIVFIIDFGLGKRYRDPKNHEHIPYKDGKNLTGTARYVSVNTHQGIEQSRRDDLESLAYVFLYFYKGSLPWQGLKATSKKDKYDKIMEIKSNTSVETLCRGAPKEFADFLHYSRNLKFWEKPNYAWCRRIFRMLFYREQYNYDFIYDWLVVPREGQQAQQSPAKSPTRYPHLLSGYRGEHQHDGNSPDHLRASKAVDVSPLSVAATPGHGPFRWHPR